MMDTTPLTIQHRPTRAGLASVYDLTLDDLIAWCVERGFRAYRARQIWTRLYHARVSAYDEMTNLPASLREQLATHLPITPLEPVRELWTDVDETLKMLYRARDGQLIETVLMFYPERATVCVSCQVGCAVGCSFCATGMGGLSRNLTAGEMVFQVVDMARRAEARGRSLTNLVMMGMGEPFHNYVATMRFIAILNDHDGFDFGARRITISTSGIVPFIDKLAEEPYQVNLAVSIHAANDELRSSLVPINDRWPLAELIAAVERYIAKTKRRVSFEYALMTGVNSSDARARELAGLLSGLLCHVNVIPYNPTPGAPYERPTKEGVERFVSVLTSSGIPATIRYSRGLDITAACGQLRADQMADTAATGV
jgi:23S rRNA (adenine2503-C2)-methyltransferase